MAWFLSVVNAKKSHKMKNQIKNYIAAIICTAGLSQMAAAQELQLTQTYGQAAITNPALLCADGNNKVTLGYHNFYGNLTSPWREYSGTAELGNAKGSSYFGLGFIHTEANNKMVNLNGVNLMYAQGIQLSKASRMRVGFQAGMRSKNFNPSGAVFEDMIDPYNGVSYPTQETLEKTQANYFTVGAGAAFNSKDFYMALGLMNLNQPSTEFQNSGGIKVKEPMRIRLLLGYGIKVGATSETRGDTKIVPHVSYTKAGSFSEIGGGLAVQNNVFCVGLGYSTFSYKASSVITTVGFAAGDIKLGYNVGINMGNTVKGGGLSHEFCASLLLFKPQKPEPARIMPTPMF